MNSCYNHNPAYGEVDLESLNTVLQELHGPIVLVGHHTMFSRYADDSSSIRNSYALIEHILKNNSIAYIHGHTHGYSDITIGPKCKVIGVGPLFKQIHDIHNQFNILTITGTQLVKIDNFAYRADTKTFSKQTLYENNRVNYFEGENLKELYELATTNVKAMNVVNNFHFNLCCDIGLFKKQVETEFAPEIKKANLWLEKNLPDEMYYNHAQYMDKAAVRGIEHVIQELERKSTSSRAIIPLINMEDVVTSGDNHLPSLDVIQFGFDDESRNKLHLTVYMRALEVNHFFKINIAEMYHLITSVCDKFRSIQTLELNIIAFRAQFKEKFGCFMKANIDAVTPQRLTTLVNKRKVEKLIEMLEEKKNLSETVVHADGIKSLSLALFETIEEENYEYYPESLIKQTKELADLYDRLIEARQRTSIQTHIEDYEGQISASLEQIIDILKSLGSKQ
jgi:thymidylate synthase